MDLDSPQVCSTPTKLADALYLEIKVEHGFPFGPPWPGEWNPILNPLEINGSEWAARMAATRTANRHRTAAFRQTKMMNSIVSTGTTTLTITV